MAALSVMGLGVAHTFAPAPNPTAPLVIRRGGSYTGTYRSSDSNVPCISVETQQPVTLRGCILIGPGDLIRANASGAQLTVRDCRGYGLPPTIDQARRGRFLEASSARSLTIEHNYFEQTTGINVHQWGGDGSPAQTLTVRYNQCRNVDGRLRGGGEEFANFLGLNGVFGLVNAEISWNEVINEPDKSLAADVINIFNSSGTRRSPLRIHDNYIQGAYPFPATSRDYAGSGITLDSDKKLHSALTTTAFVHGYRNQLVSTCAALNIAAGHDNTFFDNRIVTSGLLPNGDRLQANYAGIGLWNAYHQSTSAFFNNSFRDNTIGFVHWDSNSSPANRQDTSPDACTPCTATRHLPSPVSLATEQLEWRLWQQKLRHAAIRVGPASTASDRAAARAMGVAVQ
ncbi:glycosyl hydrolase [Hymenobacter artigasi]|uniref:glycosyl hydrolase n=1 Tax=Hymenobacter artigasi TaxID=2719616 RepID=UPI0014485DF4|nr:glycosyl hydrolase [Hymenobacter artigasi]